MKKRTESVKRSRLIPDTQKSLGDSRRFTVRFSAVEPNVFRFNVATDRVFRRTFARLFLQDLFAFFGRSTARRAARLDVFCKVVFFSRREFTLNFRNV